MQNRFAPALLLLALVVAGPAQAQELFTFPEGTQTRWISPENRTGTKGAGGQENQGAKGHAFDTIAAGDSLVLANIEGSGTIRRIWMTVSDRSPAMLRALHLKMYWDEASTPAVSAPLGDFFGAGLGQLVPFENALLSSPEGRSFNSIIPMPFREAARIVVVNEAEKDLNKIFYTINYTEGDEHDEDMLYFHSHWRRANPTTLGEDFAPLPRIEGRGRFIGTTMGVVTDSAYGDSWWGEGEVKMFLDGDDELPTLVGTGTEDYVGTGYGQGAFDHLYQGNLVGGRGDGWGGAWVFYRLHIPDPVVFDENLRVTIQQMGGWPKDRVIRLQEQDAALEPVALLGAQREQMVKMLERDPVPALTNADLPEGYVTFWRRDDVSAATYFYLDRPTNDLPPLAPVQDRTASLSE